MKHGTCSNPMCFGVGEVCGLGERAPLECEHWNPAWHSLRHRRLCYGGPDRPEYTTYPIHHVPGRGLARRGDDPARHSPWPRLRGEPANGGKRVRRVPGRGVVCVVARIARRRGEAQAAVPPPHRGGLSTPRVSARPAGWGWPASRPAGKCSAQEAASLSSAQRGSDG